MIMRIRICKHLPLMCKGKSSPEHRPVLCVSCHSFLRKPDYFSSVATVVYLRKENCMYQACPTQDCNKKVIDQQNGLYRCEKCDSEFPNFKYRMILSVSRMGGWGPLWCFLSAYQVPGTVFSSGFPVVWDASSDWELSYGVPPGDWRMYNLKCRGLWWLVQNL